MELSTLVVESTDGHGGGPLYSSFRSGGVVVAEASVDARPSHGIVRRGLAQLKAQARKSSLGRQAGVWLNRWRHSRQQAAESPSINP